MLSAGLGWLTGGLKTFFRVDQNFLPGLIKSCFPGGSKVASRVEQRKLSAGLGWFVGGLKASFRVDQNLLPGLTKSCFPGGIKVPLAWTENAFSWTRLVRGRTEIFFPGGQKLLPGWTKSCFLGGPKNDFGWTMLIRGWNENLVPGRPEVASRVDQKDCFPGGPKAASWVNQKLLLGWTKECFRLA